ncbi:MAG: O-antigen ligase family protein [Bacteroidales bacterium]|nr:O-antigen ligase family protein [Bacteroidales bacterium]
MKDKNNKWVYIISLIFIAINAFFISKEMYLFCVLPVALLIIILAFFYYDKLLLLIVFLTPLSIPLHELYKNLDFDMNLPTEPLLVGLTIIIILKFMLDKSFDKKILYHPVSIAIYFYIIWLFVTSISSTMPIVSFKFLISRLWFIIPLFFLTTQIFKDKKNFYRYFWLYIIPLLFVIIYAVTRHAQYGLLDKKIAHWAANPFYKDHTSYGAILAMFIPVLAGFATKKKTAQKKKILIWALFIIFTIALLLSYSRAAWLGVIGAFGVWIIIKLKIKFRNLAIFSIIILLLGFAFETQILMQLKRNKQDSSVNVENHIKSISNVSSDASNLERINRWKSAIRMFEKKPFFGWGPGTYMFKYAPFQLSYEKTIISTNEGNRGNAHSEYLGPLAESGIFGLISVLLIIITTIYTAINIYSKSKNEKVRTLSLISLLGLTTYYIHGFLNNFLDMDKATVPFWGFTAIIVALDVYYKNTEEEDDDSDKKLLKVNT